MKSSEAAEIAIAHGKTVGLAPFSVFAVVEDEGSRDRGDLEWVVGLNFPGEDQIAIIIVNDNSGEARSFMTL